MLVDGREVRVSGSLLQPLTRRTNDMLRVALSGALLAIVITSSLVTRTRWDGLMAQHKGKIDVDLGKAFENDDFDVITGKHGTNERTLCGRVEISPRGCPEWDWAPFYPGGTVQSKVTDGTLASRMSLWGQVGHHGSDFLVDLELSAAETENRGTVVASPRVITANQQEATISQGTEIPYQQSASSGATTIAFKDAVLSLKVKPLITPDNRIIMDLKVSDDSVGQTVVASGGVNVPSINTRSVETQVVLGDGETVVLGGILTTNQTLQAQKVPWLGDIPILGNLFKSTTNTNDKDELLIFVTPKILREGVNVN